MAWNESFNGESAGGWGAETSFATAGPKDTEISKLSDRLPVPVTISTLAASASADDKYSLGEYNFNTVSLFFGVPSNWVF